YQLYGTPRLWTRAATDHDVGVTAAPLGERHRRGAAPARRGGAGGQTHGGGAVVNLPLGPLGERRSGSKLGSLFELLGIYSSAAQTTKLHRIGPDHSGPRDLAPPSSLTPNCAASALS